MPNVENNEPEVVEVSDTINPLDRFKYSEDELAEYLKSNKIPGEDDKTRPQIVDYQKDADKALVKAVKMLVFAWKNGGKTHFLREMMKFNRKNPEMIKVIYNHVKWLIDHNHLQEITRGEGLDAEGKGDVIMSKFAGLPFRNRGIFYENGPMPTMQNPVAFIRELALFMKANTWAFSHPDLYKQKTGLDAPNAAVFENYSILTTEVMNYVRTVSHDENVEKLAAKGQELAGGPLIPKFDNWDIRDRNWDYFGGYVQHKVTYPWTATARARKIWKNNKPSDDDDIALYTVASYAFNAIIFLWFEDDNDGVRHFFGQITTMDWMEPGMKFPVIENPTYLKIMAEITKYSHRQILDKYGKWKRGKVKATGEEIEYWVENKEVSSSTSNETVSSRSEGPATLAKKLEGNSSTNPGKVDAETPKESKPAKKAPKKPKAPKEEPKSTQSLAEDLHDEEESLNNE